MRATIALLCASIATGCVGAVEGSDAEAAVEVARFTPLGGVASLRSVVGARAGFDPDVEALRIAPANADAALGPEPCVLAPIELEVLALHNAERAARGLDELVCDARLLAAARGHSEEMCAIGITQHESADGSGARERYHAAGVRYLAAGENIAGGQTTAEQVEHDWMASAVHRANILADFTRVGIAYVACDGDPQWTADFAR